MVIGAGTSVKSDTLFFAGSAAASKALTER